MTEKVKKSLKQSLAGSSFIKKLRMLHDRYLIEEDAPEIEIDNESGVTKEVAEALKTGLLYAPDQAEYYAKKFPCKGVVIAKGPKCKFDIPIGSRVAYARLGGQRIKEDGKPYIILNETDLHGFI